MGTTSPLGVVERTKSLLSIPPVTVDEVDAPHIASLVEQFHGPWRQGVHRRKATHDGFTQVR